LKSFTGNKNYPVEYRNEAAGKRSFFNLGDIL
jgi:hypothetical protein